MKTKMVLAAMVLAAAGATAQEATDATPYPDGVVTGQEWREQHAPCHFESEEPRCQAAIAAMF